MRIMVTGGAGFIGSRIVSALSGEHELAVVDDLSTGSASNLHPGVRFTRMDILDEGLVEEFVSFKPDAVVHLAAQTSVSVSVADPKRDWQVNVEGTRAVARAAREAGAKRVLSASSAAVYGEPLALPLRETACKSPQSPYGHSKLAAEEVLAAELSFAGVDFASLRLSNVYGPGQDPFGEGGVVAIFTARVLAGEELVVFGSGKQTRDFIYVDDVVAAVSAALVADTRLCEGRGMGPAYNISTGNESSVLSLVELLERISGTPVRVRHAPPRSGDIDHSVLDSTKARHVFAWDARIPLDVGLAATYAWFAEIRDVS